MKKFINQTYVVVERGDGQQITVGEFPDLSCPLSIAQFLLDLTEAHRNLGNYDMLTSEWSPRKLEES